ncbi:hypothetical protein ACHAPT_006472 [Fusarium lateritium]
MESEPPGPCLIGNLFNAILDSCANICPRVTSKEQSLRLRSELERFFLWGDGLSVPDCQLDEALATSSELHQTVLSTLYELGKLANDDLPPVIAASESADPHTRSSEMTRDLHLLLEKASIILEAPHVTEDSESLSDDESSQYSLDEVLDDMTIYIDCLMDLSLVLESPVVDPNSVDIQPTKVEPSYIEPVRIESAHTHLINIGSATSSHQTDSMSPLALPTFSTAGHDTSLGTLDLGPPGFQATITLFQDTPRERIVYLGPWEVLGSNPRRVIWQGSYQNEVLEHYFPSTDPADLHPHTIHTRHRPYSDPADLERYLSFQEPHRIRYTTNEGVCIHDESITVKYEFTSSEASIRFQGDLRRKDLVDFYDTDVVWTNVHGRTDSFGNIKGVATIQRLKLWRDRITGAHSLSIRENKTNGRYHDYSLDAFLAEISGKDDRSRQLRLKTLQQDRNNGRRPISTYRIEPRRRGSESLGPGTLTQSTNTMRYLAIQFSDREAYRRFIETWATCQSPVNEPRHQLSRPNQFELPSSSTMPAQSSQDRPQRSTLDIISEPPSLTDAAESHSQEG